MFLEWRTCYVLIRNYSYVLIRREPYIMQRIVQYAKDFGVSYAHAKCEHFVLDEH